jgi:hypothetical protein
MVNYVEKLKILFVYEIYFQNELDLEFRLENIHMQFMILRPVSAPGIPA